MNDAADWRRRARPLLGTLVEIGASGPHVDRAIDAAFDAIATGARPLSRFEPDSDVQRFAAIAVGERLPLQAPTATVLDAAARLRDATGGLFDITLGRAPHGWRLDDGHVVKLDREAQLALDGIAKGHLVDLAIDALRAQGCADGWVNAGGDLRAIGRAELALQLRDEEAGGVRPFERLADGAFATSHFAPDSRSACWPARQAHASVAAPSCLWADALTKVVAASGDARHPALARFGARAWLHPS